MVQSLSALSLFLSPVLKVGAERYLTVFTLTIEMHEVRVFILFEKKAPIEKFSVRNPPATFQRT